MNTVMSAEKMQQFKTAAIKASSMDSIGGTPVVGVDANWFYEQLVKAVEDFPEILEWNSQRLNTLAQGLYVLDAEDLMTCI